MVWVFGLATFLVCVIGSYFVARWIRGDKGSGNLHYVHHVDPELQVAIETARRSLPDFKKTLANPPSDVKAMALKIKLSGSGGDPSPEYLWADHIAAVGDHFEGVLADNPVVNRAHKKGDKVQIADADIVDWLIVHDGNLRDGGFTDEVLSHQKK